MRIRTKSREQIAAMREGGEINAKALSKVVSSASPGVSLEDLDRVAEGVIVGAGAAPAFKRVPGYHWATCLNVNEGVVHGVPSEYRLEKGDVLSIDLGTFYKGLNTDAAWTILVGAEDIPSDESKEKNRFLEVGREALVNAVAACQVGGRIGDISSAIEKTLRQASYSPSDSLVGHGIGEGLHEDPPVPCLASRDKGPKIVEGMALAIEVIYSVGGPELVLSSDGWTLATADGSLSALFEHTVIAKVGGPIVLTGQKRSVNI